MRVAVEEAGAAGRDRATPADLLSALRLENGLEPAGTLMKLGVSVARLRQAAGHPYPAGRPSPPAVPSIRPPVGTGGPLVLLGEDLDPSPGHRWALQHALARPDRPTGMPVRLVVVESAVSAPSPFDRLRERLFRLYGADRDELEIVAAGLATAADAHAPAVLDRLASADNVHLSGGNTGRLYDATVGSPFLEAVVRASVAGAVLIGGSAEAIIFGAGMWSDWYTGDPARKEAVPLWSWLDRVLVEPHYGDWGRLIWQRPADFPGHIVLGIPNRGAALVLPGYGEVEALGPEPLTVHTAPHTPPIVVPVGQRYRLPT